MQSLDDGGREDIENILRVAVARNARCNVTGALTFNDFYFAQALEGPYDAVKATFADLSRDARHAKIVVLQEG